jgi:hypothetical protein
MKNGLLMNRLVGALPSLAPAAAIGAVLLVSASGAVFAEPQAGGLPALADRVVALEAANANLKAALDAEVAARQAADAALQNAINAEMAARTAADTGIQNAINGEVAARIAADNAESAARQSADGALWTTVNNATSRLSYLEAAVFAARLNVWHSYAGGIVVGNHDTRIAVVYPSEPGMYVINAKVTLRNRDGDYQSGGCKIWVGWTNGYGMLDEANVRIGAKDDADQVSIALQGVYSGLPQNSAVTLTCGTYDGVVDDAVLTAIKIHE